MRSGRKESIINFLLHGFILFWDTGRPRRLVVVSQQEPPRMTTLLLILRGRGRCDDYDSSPSAQLPRDTSHQDNFFTFIVNSGDFLSTTTARPDDEAEGEQCDKSEAINGMGTAF